jgi:hypothetical protein
MEMELQQASETGYKNQQKGVQQADEVAYLK